MARGVPVVDISPLVGDLSGRDAAGVVARLDEACTQTGFFVCVGHGSERDVATMLAAARRLFALDPEVKAGLAMAERCGYVDDGAKEMFDIALDRDASAPNRWPPLDGFRPLVGRYQAQVLTVAETLLAALALALGTRAGLLRRSHAPPRELPAAAPLPAATGRARSPRGRTPTTAR